MPLLPETDGRIRSLIDEIERQQATLAHHLELAGGERTRSLLVRRALLDDALRWLYAARLETADEAAGVDLKEALRLMAEAASDGQT